MPPSKLVEFVLGLLTTKGHIVEQFIALHHVKYTTSEALKDVLFGILDKYKIYISSIRWQGYD